MNKIKKNSISVIIPSFYRYETVNEELKLFSQQTILPDEILIIDQTPLEERKIFDIKKYPNLNIKLFFQDKPNACIARNFGAKKAKSKYLLIVDDDIVFKEDFIESHLMVMEDENVDVVNGGVTLKNKLPKKYPWNISYMDSVRFFLSAPNYEWEGMMLSVSSCNFSIKKIIYEAVNGFDPIIPRMHDFEFGFRLFKYGAKIYYSHKPWCKHLRASGGLRKKPKNHNKLVSALYIHNKHFPGWITTQFKLWFIFSVFNRKQFWKRPWRPFIFPFKIYKLLKANKVAKKLVKKSKAFDLLQNRK